MAMLKRKSSRRLVLDIGTSAIRLCELTHTKTGFQLSKYYQRDMLIDPALDDEAKYEIRVETLRSLLKEAKVRTKKTILAVAGQSVFTRKRPLPPVPVHKVTQIVKYEIQQQIPFPPDQIALGYQILDRTEAGGYDVLMAAIKVDVVEKQLEILRDVKRTVDIVDVTPFAAYNWLKHTGEFGEQGDCVALMDIGAATTDIVIEREGQYRFTRPLNAGGNDITKAIMDTFGMSFGEAEKLKRDKGFAPTGDPQRDGKGGEVIGRALSRLVGEVKRTFAYFRSQAGGGPVNRVVITGGGACLRNIIPYLQRELGMEVRIAQPLAGVAVAPGAQDASEFPEQAAVALGLALRNIQSVPIELNLIPPRVAELARKKEQAFYWALSMVTLGLIGASIIPVRANEDKSVQDQIQHLESVIRQYDPKLLTTAESLGESNYEVELRKVKSDVGSIKKELRIINNAYEDRIDWLAHLRTINSARPDGEQLWFSSFQSVVLGGASNTGRAWKDKGKPATAEAPAAEDQEVSPLATSPIPEPDDDRRGGGSRLMMLASRMEAAGGAGVGQPGSTQNAQSGAKDTIPFPGIHPAFGAGGQRQNILGGGTGGGGRGGGRGGRGGRDDDDVVASQTPAAMASPTKTQEPNPITMPNAISIVGYCDKLDTLKAFQQRLKDDPSVVAVYLKDTEVIETPISTLNAAQIVATPQGQAAMAGGSLSGGSGGGGRNRDDDDERGRGGFSGLRNLGAASGISGGGTAVRTPTYPGEPMIFEFKMQVQFMGDPVGA